MLKRVNQQLLVYFLDFDRGSMPKFKHNFLNITWSILLIICYLTAKVKGHKTDNSIMHSLCQITWFSILILTCILTFSTHEAFSQDESQLPDIDDEIIVKVNALNVRLNHEIPEVDPEKNIKFEAEIGDRGIVRRGPVVIPPYNWYEIGWG